MFKKLAILALLAALAAPAAFADQITQIVQQDLQALGYAPGNTNGELDPNTIVAISKFQAENDLEVTGEPTPQLAGIIKAQLNPKVGPGSGAQAATVAPMSQAELQAAQQACLQKKMEEAQASQKKKRGFGSLMRAAARTATRFGNNDVSSDIARASSDVYAADATAKDLKSAAKDLGLTESDVEACRNPSS
jgi:peptidoglycan hydrolase-like protein with peptidoglycan-binding domain